MCERTYHAIQAVAQSVTEYDRITWILAAVAIIIAALGVMFTAASVVLALGAIRGWKELIREAKDAAERVAQEEGKKWADIYSDPARMFEAFGVRPAAEASAPAPKIDPEEPIKPIGEQLVEAMAQEPGLKDESQAVEASTGEEESDVVSSEITTQPCSESEPGGEPEPDSDRRGE